MKPDLFYGIPDISTASDMTLVFGDLIDPRGVERL
jgi:hypothetical protein